MQSDMQEDDAQAQLRYLLQIAIAYSLVNASFSNSWWFLHGSHDASTLIESC